MGNHRRPRPGVIPLVGALLLAITGYVAAAGHESNNRLLVQSCATISVCIVIMTVLTWLMAVLFSPPAPRLSGRSVPGKVAYDLPGCHHPEKLVAQVICPLIPSDLIELSEGSFLIQLQRYFPELFEAKKK